MYGLFAAVTLSICSLVFLRVPPSRQISRTVDDPNRAARIDDHAVRRRDSLFLAAGLMFTVLQTFLWVGSTLSRMVFKEDVRWKAWSCTEFCSG